MTIVKENAPHIRRKASVTRMMVDVLIALAPTLIFSFVVYPLNTLINYVISLAIMIGAEFVFVGLKNMMPKTDEKHTFKEKFIYAYKGKYQLSNVLTPAITAVIYTLIMPAGAPVYAVIIGALVGIVFGKLVFGGLGSNIFNPAAVGMLFAKLCFGSQYKSYVDTWYYTVPDAAAGATPLGTINGGNFSNIFQYNLFDLFFGRIPGTLGEVYKITILIGLLYLLIRRSADFRIVVSYLGTFILVTLCAGLAIYSKKNEINPFYFTLYGLLSGGVLFGATFMLTDPVTSPINSPSRIIYGMVAAIATVFIRLFAALPEGVGFSILIANMVACVLDHYEWSNPRYTWKKFLAMGLLIVIPCLIAFLAIRFGGIYNV
ncbi:MAG: RnfABCDGE type electron transport complex subunit D [Bacilli bacterium]|nr:RnfABCDGE type electron transport complex subunit D [Bacilli bacterium]